MEHYSNRFKKPAYNLTSPYISTAPYIPILVEYFKRTVGEIQALPIDDIIHTLDVVYSRLLNEQRYYDHLNKHSQKRL